MCVRDSLDLCFWSFYKELGTHSKKLLYKVRIIDSLLRELLFPNRCEKPIGSFPQQWISQQRGGPYFEGFLEIFGQPLATVLVFLETLEKVLDCKLVISFDWVVNER